jgi:hypothetical protein
MQRLPIEPSKLAAVCGANGIRKLSLFGSQLQGTARPDRPSHVFLEKIISVTLCGMEAPVKNPSMLF